MTKHIGRAAMGLALVLGLSIVPTVARAEKEGQTQMSSIFEMSRVKALVPDTQLTRNGKAEAEIIVPEVSGYRKLAEQVRDAVKSASGAALPIRNDSEVATHYGEVKGGGLDRNVIVLGNLETSGLVAHLYGKQYCSEDAMYPGKGGYTIRTICDPWGRGTNVILLGGSDEAGVAKAVSHFCEKLPKGSSLQIPRTFEAEFGPELLARYPELKQEPSDKTIADLVKAGDQAFRAGKHGGLLGDIATPAFNYMRSGKEGYAKLFCAMLFLADDLRRQDLGTYGGPWGMDADFYFAELISAWDCVEESPSISAQDRLRITRIILDYIHYWEDYWSVKDLNPKGVRNNHTTFTSLGFMFAADYFGKYYQAPEAERWMKIADTCFHTQQVAFKPQEDSNSYQWITLRHVMRYALSRTDPTFLTSGMARISCDLAIMTMDNLGYQTSFGDVGSFTGGTVETNIWGPMALAEKDGRYMWALRKAIGARGRPGLNSYANEIPPVEPKDLLGVKWLPTDKSFYEQWNGNGKVPQEKTFDKITFRTSFDAERQYLLLDGISACGHGHYDGNSILRLSDRGRIWLADCDYIKSLPKFHNMLLIFRDGQSFGLPTFSDREITADLGQIGFTRTTTPDYSGADWSRNILWSKENAFVVIDEVQARVADEFSLRCHWHTLGDPRLDGSLYQVTQKGPSFFLRNLDGARLRRFDDAEVGKNWNGYKFAEPVIRTLQQVHTLKLSAGQRVFFLNVLSTSAAGGKALAAERVSESSVLLGSGAERALVGVSAKEGEILPGLVSDAKLYWIGPERIALAQVTVLKLNGKTILTSDAPVSVELDAQGKAIIAAEKPAKIRIAGDAAKLTLDGKKSAASRDGELTHLLIPAGRHEIAGLSAGAFALELPKPQPISAETSAGSKAVKTLAPIAEFRGEMEPTRARIDADPKAFSLALDPQPLAQNALAPDTTQKASSLSDGLKSVASDSLMWGTDQKVALIYTLTKPTRLSQLTVHAWWGETSSKGLGYQIQEIRVLVGKDANSLTPWASTTVTRKYPDWSAPVPFVLSPETPSAAPVSVVRIEVTPRAGKGVYLAEVELQGDLSGNGIKKSKRFLSLAPSEDGLIAGNEDGKAYSLGADLKLRWSFDAGSAVKAVWSGRLSPNEPSRVAVGTLESEVNLLDSAGKLVWKKELPFYKRKATVRYFSSVDSRGDGNCALVVGSENWHHYAFNSDGQERWEYESIHASTAGTPIDLNGDGKQEYIAGTEYYWWHALNPDGTRLWQYRTAGGPRTNQVRAADVLGEGKPLVFFGGADGSIQTVDTAAQMRWMYNTGDEVTGLELADLDGDGMPEVVASSLSFNLQVVKGDGKRLWRQDVGEPILSMSLADLDGDGKAEVAVGTEEGRVLVFDGRGALKASWIAPSAVRMLAVVPGSPARLAAACDDGALILLAMK